MAKKNSVTFIAAGGLVFGHTQITIPCQPGAIDDLFEAGAHTYQVTITKLDAELPAPATPAAATMAPFKRLPSLNFKPRNPADNCPQCGSDQTNIVAELAEEWAWDCSECGHEWTTEPQDDQPQPAPSAPSAAFEMTMMQKRLMSTMYDGHYIYRNGLHTFMWFSDDSNAYSDTLVVRPLIEHDYLYEEPCEDGTRWQATISDGAPARPTRKQPATPPNGATKPKLSLACIHLMSRIIEYGGWIDAWRLTTAQAKAVVQYSDLFSDEMYAGGHGWALSAIGRAEYELLSR